MEQGFGLEEKGFRSRRQAFSFGWDIKVDYVAVVFVISRIRMEEVFRDIEEKCFDVAGGNSRPSWSTWRMKT